MSRLQRLISIPLILALILSLGVVMPPPEAVAQEPGETEPITSSGPAKSDLRETYPIMRLDRETLLKWEELYDSAPAVHIDPDVTPADTSPGSHDLLGLLDYVPLERNQGSCGNCWAWASTGVLGIALNVQEGVFDRLSIQYLNSNYNGGSGPNWACCGGNLWGLAGFYDPCTGTGQCIPWSNNNAYYQDATQNCAGSTNVPAGDITTFPNYGIDSCTAVTVPTHGLDQATAIDNIKNVLHQDRAIYFGFSLPTSAEWGDFYTFWNSELETALWDPDPYCGMTMDDSGGGHGVLCVGYNDDDPDPDNYYWIMLNSWGTAGGNRPNGLFRVKMDINYDCILNWQSGGTLSALRWSTLDVDFDLTPPLDHFKLYPVVDGLAQNEPVLLEDQFSFYGEATVLEPHFFGNPVEKLHGELLTPIANPDSHLTVYSLHPGGTPEDWFVEVNNQFGVQHLKVSGPVELAVPTQKDPHAPPEGLDHFLLYEVTEGEPVNVVVDLWDQFGDDAGVLVLQPVYFANPVWKDHGGEITPIGNPDAHLVFYQIAGGAHTGDVLVANQFQSGETLSLTDPYLLAVPSAKSRFMAGEPVKRVAVLGDYGSQLTDLLWANNMLAEQRDWDVISDIADYEVVVVNMPSDPGQATFLDFLDAASDNRVGVVFTSSYAVWDPWGISLLEWYFGDPAGQDQAFYQGDVYYKVTRAHPIFAGWNVDDEIAIITGGDYDHTWFWGYSGVTIAEVGSADVGVRGDAVAVRAYGGSKHVLLASLGPQSWTSVPDWTADAETIFINAVHYAQPEPEPALLDHFEFYWVYDPPYLGEPVYLEDQFTALDAVVEYLTFFGNPAAKWHDGLVTPISNPDHHLSLYSLEHEAGFPCWEVEVDNQFGPQTLIVAGPNYLGVPTHKLLPGEHGAPVGLDHFMVYWVKNGPSLEVVVGLEDEFGYEEVVVLDPIFFANPVEKDHDGVITPIENPEEHLVFYWISGGSYDGEVLIANQFDEDAMPLLTDAAFLAAPTDKVSYKVHVGATIDPTEEDYDLTHPADVATTITWNDSTAVDVIYDGTDFLTAGTDYAVVGNTLNVLDAYLSGKLTASGQSVDLIIVFDDYCCPLTFTITAVQGVSPTIDPTEADYDLTHPDDVITTITWNDASSVVSVEDGVGTLAAGTDYTVVGNTLTVLDAYLSGKLTAVDDQVVLSITFDYCNPVIFTITAVQGTGATIDPTEADYDLTHPDDVITTITWNDASSVVSVEDGVGTLAAGTDYTVVGNTLTVLDAYLSGKLTAVDDQVVLSITFDYCNPVIFTITAVQGTGATIDPTEEDYDVTHPADVATTITWNDSTAVDTIHDGTDYLTAGTDYTVVDNTLAILDAYLSGKLTAVDDQVVLTITFDYCNPLTFTITAVEGTGASIDPTEADYDLYAPGDVTTTITWNDASSVDLVEDEVGALTPDTDYTVVGSTLTVLDAYLSGKLTAAGQSVELTITFDYCNPLTFTITAIDTAPPSEVWVCESTGSDDNPGTETEPFATIQKGIDEVAGGGTVHVAAGTYDLAAPIVVDKALTLTGDTTAPENVVVNAGTIAGDDGDCFQVKASGVTIQGFKMQGAYDADSGAQNAAVMIGTHWTGPAIIGLQNIDISYNEITDCTRGIYVYRAQNVIISHNKIHDMVIAGAQAPSVWPGKGIELRGDGDPTETQCNNIQILSNEIYNCELLGIEVNLWEMTPDETFVDVDVLIQGNTIYNNGGNWAAVVGFDAYVYRGISCNGQVTGVTIDNNEIYGHDSATFAPHTVSGAIRINDEKEHTITSNYIHHNHKGIRISKATYASLSGFVVSSNDFESNTIQVDDAAEALDLEAILTDNTFDRAVVVRGSPIKVPTIFSSIQDAIDAAVFGDTVDVAAGTYPEYLHITTDGLTVQGAGIDQSIIDLDGLIPYWHYSPNKSFASRAGVLISGWGSPDDIIEGVTFSGFTVKNAGLNPPITATGQASAADPTGTVLTDGTASFPTDGSLVGQWLHNVSDKLIVIDISGNNPIRSYGQITANTATTITATLAGGQENDWDIGDTYVIMPYEEYVDVAEDLQDDVPGIGIHNGKDVTISYCKVIDSGSSGIGASYARLVSAHKYSEGVTIDHCISSDNHVDGISIGKYVGAVTITNNTCSNNGRPHPTDPSREYDGKGIEVSGLSISQPISGVISDNICANNKFEGIVLKDYSDGVTIENNTVTGSNLDQDGAGIFFYGKSSTPSNCDNHIIRNNTVTGNIRGIVAYYAQYCTIEGNTITTDSGAFPLGQGGIKLDGANNMLVQNNTLSSLDGIGIKVQNTWDDVESYDNTITGNLITGAQFAGIPIWGGAHDNTFTCNTITGTTVLTFWAGEAWEETQADGVFIDDDAGTGNVFHWNNIYGNADDGMENQIATTVDARYNWWGDASGPSGFGPGSGDAVSDYVLFYPWLHAEIDCSEPPPYLLDHFKLYHVMDGLPVSEVVLLADQFGAYEAMVEMPLFFGNPVEKEHEGGCTPIWNLDDHLTFYGLSPIAAQEWNVEIYNQFGLQALTVSNPVILAVPTQKAPHEPNLGPDHYLLYEVIDGEPLEMLVLLQDQFSGELWEETLVLEPVYFANPVAKAHGDVVIEIEDPEAHLVFYRIAGEYAGSVSIDNQFGPATLFLSDAALLALPSDKISAEPDVIVCETDGTFTSSAHKPGTWSYDISITRNTADREFVSGTITLTASDSSVITGTVMDVKCDYAHWSIRTPNFAAVGTATYGTYTGNFIFLIADSHIQMVLSTADYSAVWAAETLWSSEQRDYNILGADGGFWVDCLCPPEPVGASISPDTASYDLGDPADVATTITWNDASSVVSVYDGSGYLTGSDYTVVGDTLTILDAYLSTKLTAGGESVVLTIDFDVCEDATFTITAVEGVPCETSGTFTSSRHKPGTWSYDISIIRDGAGQFVSGTIVLTAPDAIVVTGTVLDVKCDYAHWASRTPNFAAAGTATYGTWTGYFMFLLADSHIQMLLSTSDYSAPWAAETLWSSGQRAYDIVAADGGFWVDCLCPAAPACATIDPTGASYNLLDPDDAMTTITWNDASSVVSVYDGSGYLTGSDYTVVGDTLTILDAYLSTKLTAGGESVVLTIDFDVCDDATFTITAVEGVPCETSGTFTSSRHKPGTWSYDISIIRDGAGQFVSGTIVLTAPDAIVVTGTVLDVKCDYAHWASRTPNFAAAGTATYGTWTGYFIFLLADSHIQMLLSTSDYSAPWAAETLWSSGQRAYDIVAADGGFWVDCLCPVPPACATISPTGASYNLLDPDDATTTITWNDASSVVSVYDGSGYLTGSDYTVVGDTLTILDAYLSTKLTAGGESVVLTIDFDVCDDATFTITAVEGILCETSGTFTSSRHKPGTWSYDISIIRDGAGQFVSGTIVLTAPDAIVVTGTVLDVKCDYAHWASRTPNFAAAGTATYGTWTGYFIFLLADSHIQMLLSTSDYSAPWAAETLWSSGQRAYDIVAADGGFWVSCLCPL